MDSEGFPPIADDRASVLVLGSLPGQLSLQMRQYYAQPRNAFWKIMGELFGAGLDLPYVPRTRRLIESGVALWDVCAAAHRPGSLDSAISFASVVPNDFATFLAAHPRVGCICFNGAKAFDLYRRAVLPKLPEAMRQLRLEVMPSTSPAHASVPFAQKLARWSDVREYAKPPRIRD